MGCADNECIASVRWSISNNTLLSLYLEASVQLLLNQTNNILGTYVAVGFSNDRRMALSDFPAALKQCTALDIKNYWLRCATVTRSGLLQYGEDMVIECVYNGRGDVRPFISYNDGLHNAQLHAASEELITDANSSIIDDYFSCEIELDFERRELLSAIDQLKTSDVTSAPFYLQLALGYADPYTFAKKKHSLWDGPLFPWTSSEAVSLQKTSANGYYIVNEATQSVTHISRNLTYVLVTLHGLIMLWAWWFLVSNAILMARYCKIAWPSTKLCGAAVWFQFHRSFMIASIALQIVAFLFVITQAGFSFHFWCTMQCTMEHFSVPKHTWSGLIAISLALLQPFFATIRPSPISNWRHAFNVLHWLVGMTSFVVASVAMISSIPLGKTALAKHYGKLPNFWMGLYLVHFTGVSIILEILVSRTVSKERRRDAESTALIYSKVPTNERHPSRTVNIVCVSSFSDCIRLLQNRRLRAFVLLLHMAGSFAICSYISKMIIDNYFRSH
ncbi:unnamed protein product [Anisakis simplex]|uniref:ascorbate ferrireductase (transmembrane) n=1 Tax=Anisakis simplex TaxID=6269 RepID=A0A0M3K4F0_ANISI|nr:unnamed protein product [Anisakis simplex]